MSRPYTKQYRSLAARGGERTVWELNFPSRCVLTQLVVKQVGGVLTPFTVDVFTARVAAVGSQSSGGGDPDGEYAADPDNYRVCDTIDSDSPGRMMRFFDGSEGVFENMDSRSPSLKRYRIYLETEPEGAGDKTYDVTLVAIVEQFN